MASIEIKHGIYDGADGNWKGHKECWQCPFMNGKYDELCCNIDCEEGSSFNNKHLFASDRCPGPGVYRLVSEEKIQELNEYLRRGFRELNKTDPYDRSTQEGIDYAWDKIRSIGLGKEPK